MAGEVIVDALPYIDQGYDEPGIREAVIILKKYFFLVVRKLK
jgi:pre-mRNA-splicing factor SPF27